MKRTISVVMVLAIITTFFTAFSINSTAMVSYPESQIWEGEDDLRLACTANRFGILPSGQEILHRDNINDNGIYSSYGQQLLWGSKKAGDYLEFTINVETSGSKNLYAKLMKAKDFGIFNFYWDNVKIGENIDLFKSSADMIIADFGTHTVTPGTHIFKVETVGVNAASPYQLSSSNPRAFFAIDYLEIRSSDSESLAYTVEDDPDFGITTVLADGTIRYEGEKMTKIPGSFVLNTDYKDQYYQIAKYDPLSFGKHFLFQPQSGGKEFNLEFEVAEAGEYSAVVNSMTSPEFGCAIFKIDGTAVSESVDLYSTVEDRHTVRTQLSNITLSSGTHTLTVRADSKNPLNTSKYYMVSVDYLDLRKTDTPYISGSSLTLGADLTVNYYAIVYGEPASVQMRFTMNGKQTVVNGSKTAKASEYIFPFTGVSPQCIGDNIGAELLVNGAVVKTKEAYSVKAYCTKMLSMSASSLGLSEEKYASLRVLIADLLEYGTQAQIYKNYKTEALFNVGISGKSEYSTLASGDRNVGNVTANENNMKFTSAGLWFDNVNKLYFKFTADNISGVTVRINGTAADIERFDATTYIVYTDGITATGFDSIYTVELLQGETGIQTITYSVKSYVYAMQSSANASMAELAKATYNYGISAILYADAE